MGENSISRFNKTENLAQIKLDVKDKKILAILSANCRMPLSKIAHEVGLSRDSVDYRIKRMVDKGIIVAFVPVLETSKFGYNYFHVFLLLEESDQQKRQQFIEDLKVHPNVKSVIEYSDRWDLEVVLIAKTVLDFDNVITEILSKHTDVVLEKSKLGVIKYYSSRSIPCSFYEAINEQNCIDANDYGTAHALDEKDLQIISILSRDARVSTYKIAEQAGLSADTVSYRIKNMLKSKYILKFGILLNLSLLNYEWYTFAIQVKTLDEKHEQKFKEFIKNHPYIIRAVKTLGSHDLLLYIVTDSSAAFHSTIKSIKNQFSDIISNYQTWVGYKEHEYNHFPAVLEHKASGKHVLVFGSFDVLHPGHVEFFKEAKKHGDYLTVVVARNDTIKKVKGQEPKYDENDRLEHVKALGIVDSVMLGYHDNKYNIIKKLMPDVICLGYDQKSFTEHLEEELKKIGVNAKVVRLNPYKEHKYKSSKLKE